MPSEHMDLLADKVWIDEVEQIPELPITMWRYASMFFEWRNNDRRLRLPRMTHAARRYRSERAGHRALYPKNRKQRKSVEQRRKELYAE